MQTSATSSTGHDTIDPRYDTTRSAPVICCSCSICVLDQTTPTIRYGVPIISATTISSPIVT
jgi:hypothetical protein